MGHGEQGPKLPEVHIFFATRTFWSLLQKLPLFTSSKIICSKEIKSWLKMGMSQNKGRKWRSSQGRQKKNTEYKSKIPKYLDWNSRQGFPLLPSHFSDLICHQAPNTWNVMLRHLGRSSLYNDSPRLPGRSRQWWIGSTTPNNPMNTFWNPSSQSPTKWTDPSKDRIVTSPLHFSSVEQMQYLD